jgi:uncharacterized protein (DUF1501 family)
MSVLDRVSLFRARRSFLGRAAGGMGAVALASLLNPEPLRAGETAASKQRGAVNPLHFAPKAKRVIWLYMSGGPSHLETFDHKPELAKLDGRSMPESFTSGQPIAQLQGQALKCLAPQYKFQRFGKSGQEMTELFPHLGTIADEMCIIRSMVTDAINHDPAHTLMNTGTTISGRPSMGSWLTYGLGSESQNLPGFVVLTSQAGRSPQPISTRMWHSGFLPGKHQGVLFRSQGEPVLYVKNPSGVDKARQEDVVSAAARLNALHDQAVDDPEIATRISQYEMAFAMQTSVPGLLDVSDESQATLAAYGTRGADGSFAGNCLLARRLAERGVRFIQLYHRDWDHHNNLRTFLPECAKLVDKATGALVNDLRQRGLLEETLVVWGGEFGRTPMSQSNKGQVGRDHHMKGFSLWLCGGGIKGGITLGNTDELGYNSVEDIVHVNDLHATLLHQLGIDHERLTYRFQGRDFRLTDVGGKVVRKVLA